MAEKITLEVLNPKGVLVDPAVEGLHAPRPTDLNGKRIALLSEKPDATIFFNSVEKQLKARYPDCSVVRMPSYTNPLVDDELVDRVDAACDVWMSGVKNATSLLYDGDCEMERRGKPGLSFSVDVMVPQKECVAEINGVPTVRVFSVSALDYAKSKADQDLMDKVVEGLFDDIIAALTAPLTEAEMNPPQFAYDYSPITLTGDSYQDVLQQFQDYCMDNEMGDGFPLIPPTRELVDEMLKGTSYPPDKEIGIVLPRGGIATVEKIAINAVMAGAKPAYLPVIITMLECITDKSFNQYHINCGIPPVYWMSGPIIEELGINNDVNYLGPGNKVNNAITRAVALCQINIGWRILSVYADPGGAGRPDNFTNYLVPENLRYGPWEESYAVSRGYKPEETIISASEFLAHVRGPGETLQYGGFDESMRTMARIFRPSIMHFGESVGGKNLTAKDRRYIVVMHPVFAHQLAEHGYTKKSFVQWLHDQNSVDWDAMDEEGREKFRQEVLAGKWPGALPSDCAPGFKVEPFDDPDNVAVIVSGGCCGGTSVYMTTFSSTARFPHCSPDFVESAFMTKVVHGATMTKYGK